MARPAPIARLLQLAGTSDERELACRARSRLAALARAERQRILDRERGGGAASGPISREPIRQPASATGRRLLRLAHAFGAFRRVRALPPLQMATQIVRRLLEGADRASLVRVLGIAELGAATARLEPRARARVLRRFGVSAEECLAYGRCAPATSPVPQVKTLAQTGECRLAGILQSAPAALSLLVPRPAVATPREWDPEMVRLCLRQWGGV
jgi:hypothetical protein